MLGYSDEWLLIYTLQTRISTWDLATAQHTLMEARELLLPDIKLELVHNISVRRSTEVCMYNFSVEGQAPVRWYGPPHRGHTLCYVRVY